ncbi:MAG: S-layer homology domain-containing protein, partial [Vulcanimicrobiaceae bacterium]
MKRCAPVVLAASLIVGSFVGMRVTASASPFGDVQPGHWAYAYIQSLAADGLIEGYPDGQFKGDRPMTRYEMATLVARAVAKLRTENHENLAKLASKGDLDKLQRLVFALKDELDGLGVRVSTVEDEVAALDRKTKVAQSIQVHGEIRANGTARNRTTIARTIDNGTGISQPLYYGGVAPAGGSAPADPFVNAFLTSDDTNLPYVANLPGVQLRQNDRLKLSYAINDNLMVSLPIHVLNFEYGYGLAQQQKIQI